jgi:hypothetical protein
MVPRIRCCNHRLGVLRIEESSSHTMKSTCGTLHSICYKLRPPLLGREKQMASLTCRGDGGLLRPVLSLTNLSHPSVRYFVERHNKCGHQLLPPPPPDHHFCSVTVLCSPTPTGRCPLPASLRSSRLIIRNKLHLSPTSRQQPPSCFVSVQPKTAKSSLSSVDLPLLQLSRSSTVSSSSRETASCHGEKSRR